MSVRNSRRVRTALFAAYLLGSVAAWSQTAAAQEQADIELRAAALAAITRAQQFLAGRQESDGSWAYEGHVPGTTALVVISLMYSGQTPEDPPVRRGLQYLQSVEIPDNTYDVSLMAMALSLAGDSRYQGRIRSLAQWLIEAQHNADEPGPGAWGYKRDDRTWWDNSNTQFAVLGLREAVHAGVEVPREVWLRAQQHFLNYKSGNPDAGGRVFWYYNDSQSDARGSMQVAGLSSLMITYDMLQDDQNVRPNGEIDCCGATDDTIQKTIEAGFRWLGAPGTFAVTANPAKGRDWHLYYLYGLERAGRFTGRRFIGESDWYRLGVRFLIGAQNPRDGSWFDNQTVNRPTVGTALALIFLSKGNSPVLINKLKYGDPKGEQFARGWNRHWRDAANLTEYISTRPRWPRLMSWQVVDLDVAAREQDGAALLQAKVQLLTGDGPLTSITSEEVQLLRDYIDQGGFLLAVNTCGGHEFEQGMHELVRKMFPEGEFKLERLPATHDVYRSENVFLAADGVDVPELWGVDIGCRTAIMYVPFDHACRWTKWMHFDPPRRDVSVRLQIKKSMELGVNIIAYATGRELLDALTEQEQLAKIDPDELPRGKLEIARLRHSGGWDTAPSALRHLQTALENIGVRTRANSPNLAASDPALFDFPVAYMHGRKNFRFTEAEQAQLRLWLQQGGVLVADACCGAAQFDESFRKLMRELFNRDLEAIPLDHELLQSPLGFDIRQVRRRLPVDSRAGAPLQSEYSVGPPMLEGITDERGRYVVVYSKYDLSCALERQATVNCAGYASEDAAKIATNIVLYAITQ